MTLRGNGGGGGRPEGHLHASCPSRRCPIRPWNPCWLSYDPECRLSCRSSTVTQPKQPSTAEIVDPFSALDGERKVAIHGTAGTRIMSPISGADRLRGGRWLGRGCRNADAAGWRCSTGQKSGRAGRLNHLPAPQCKSLLEEEEV
jgi:hypothetical protein